MSLRTEDIHKEDPEEVFQLMDVIGEGSYGFICTCKDTKSNQIYAVKFLEIEDNDPALLQKEMDILKECQTCPYTVQYHGCYMKEGSLMFVMEYCEGGSVLDLMNYCNKKLSEDEIAVICAHMVHGLHFLHKNHILHRDLKAGNVLLTRDGKAKLADFGVSAKLTTTLQKKQTMVGSPYWMAPEVITNSGTNKDGYNLRADIWSLGITAMEMAEGQPPLFEVSSMRVIFMIPKQPPPELKEPSKWSPEFANFLHKCLQKDPTARPSTAELLQHPFILKGMQKEKELQKLIVENIPILIEARKKRKEEEEKGGTSGSEGTNPSDLRKSLKKGSYVKTGSAGTFVVKNN